MTHRCLIPKWLLWLAGAMLLPWGIWITYTVIRHDVEREWTNLRLERLEAK